MKQLVERDGSYVKVVEDGDKWKIVTGFLGLVVGPRLVFAGLDPEGQVEGIETKEEAERLSIKWNDILKAQSIKKKRRRE